MNQVIGLPVLEQAEIHLEVKREDLLHPIISGNKFRKLKYNLIEARNLGCDTLLTFGGAYSNHILATACAGFENGFKTVGVIRGEELEESWEGNPTLEKARSFGMQFKFVSRTEYRHRNDPTWQARIASEHDPAYIIPEGGSNALGIKGCLEILEEYDDRFDLICCAVGTGATLAGLAESCKAHQHIIGFSALKGDFLRKDIRNFTSQSNWTLDSSYHFGGYARSSENLVNFINSFRKETGILLDPVYTGKLFFGIFDRISKGKFRKGSKILGIHTGGLQGIEGFNLRQEQKNLTQIEV